MFAHPHIRSGAWARSTTAPCIRILLVLLEERSVSAAARRIGVTQPVVRHSRRALREARADPLLVSGARGVAPTPRAMALVGPLRRPSLDRAAFRHQRSGLFSAIYQ